MEVKFRPCWLIVWCGVFQGVLTAPVSPMCAEFAPTAVNQTVLGKCSSYTTLDYDHHRDPKYIALTICQGGCKCCGIPPYRLLHKLNATMAAEINNSYDTDYYYCLQQTTTINVNYTGSQNIHYTRPYTFFSDCLCARHDTKAKCNKP